MKFCWYIPFLYLFFYFLNRYVGVLKWGKNLAIDQDEVLKFDFSRVKIIYHIVTRGTNVRTATLNAVNTKEINDLVKKRYGLNYDYEVWLVTEEDSYDKFRDVNGGKIRVIAIPKNFETEKGTKYKGRALEYSRRLMLLEGLINDNVFIYYQDEESYIGEDTVFGILEFICRAMIDGSICVGRGIILYPRNFEKKGLNYWEFYRSAIDLDRLLFTNKITFHGSHFIVKSKILRDITFDSGETLVEDFIFYNKVSIACGERGVVFIKGFCYECSPKSVHDLLKQRSRWFIGIAKSLANDSISWRRKLITLYYLICWLSSLPSLVATFLNLVVVTPPPIDHFMSSMVSSFVLYNLFNMYLVGYRLNRKYIRRSHATHIKAFVGLLAEAASPYVAIFRYISGRTKGFEVIKKD
ncbi:MAG: glycosyltransferase family 2 protein [Thermofilaceae archaeon]|nr:glycosyltransferase family 2 protein [Thermofilaceae archaeon]